MAYYAFTKWTTISHFQAPWTVQLVVRANYVLEARVFGRHKLWLAATEAPIPARRIRA